MSVDFEAINQSAISASPAILERWLPNGRIAGKEYEIGNLQGDAGASCKINIDTGKWSDFEAGQSGGDLISLYAAIHRIEQVEAARRVSSDLGINAKEYKAKTKNNKKTTKKPSWTPVHPVPDNAPPHDFSHFKHGKPDFTWHYRDSNGALLGVIARYNKEQGKKEVIPWTWCRSETGTEKWHTLSFTKPRPIYGLQALAQHPDKPVIIVEGEKACDAANRLLEGKAIAISWPGGGKAIKHVDWSPLKERAIAIWPDADDAGMSTAEGSLDDYGVLKEGLSHKLLKIASRVKILQPPEHAGEGWDIADAEIEGWNHDRVIDFIKSEARDPINHQKDGPAQADFDEYAGYADGEPVYDIPDEIDDSFFKPLGYNKGNYYFMSHRGHQVMDVSGNALTSKGTLLQLAPLHYWERDFGGLDEKSRDRAANTLIDQCYSLGVFRPERMRGRGAWWDDGQTVVHMGDRLVVGENETVIHNHKSRFVYEAALPIRCSVENPLTIQEANRFRELCDSLMWEKPVYGTLFAGWCMVAPVCGSLPWRPHIWITSPSGGGKSWVLANIIKPVLGDVALAAQSSTSEAGLRQVLGCDSRPVIFDEAESNDSREAARIDNVLALMRQASSDGDGKIYKGTTTGKAMSFDIRSSFVMASINVNIKQRADASRITVLELMKDNSQSAQDHFKHKIKPLAQDLMQEEWCLRLQARAIRHIPVLRRNAQIFAEAAGEHLGDSRLGDQLGAMLAGAYLLNSNKEVNLDMARDWVAKQDWGDQKAILEEKDELTLLGHLLESQHRMQRTHGSIERTIGEIIARAANLQSAREDVFDAKDALQELGRLGMKVFHEDGEQWLAISNTHKALKHILKETRFSVNWGRTLKHLPGAKSSGKTYRFAQSVSVAVMIPIKEIFTDEPQTNFL